MNEKGGPEGRQNQSEPNQVWVENEKTEKDTMGGYKKKKKSVQTQLRPGKKRRSEGLRKW